jgi:hypothetical protein
MTSSVQSLLSDKRTILSQIRPIALFIALLFALPAAALPKFSLWFVFGGILSCVLVAMYLELKSEQEEEKEELLAVLPAEYEGLGSFADVVFLELKQPSQPGQLEWTSIVGMQKDRGQRKTATVVHLAGKNHYLVDSDRFVALLLDKMMQDADKAAEHAILMGMKRYGDVRTIDRELERFLSDKTVIEVIKSDFRGNMLMVINRSGEKVIRELIKKALSEATKTPVLRVSPPEVESPVQKS